MGRQKENHKMTKQRSRITQIGTVYLLQTFHVSRILILAFIFGLPSLVYASNCTETFKNIAEPKPKDILTYLDCLEKRIDAEHVPPGAVVAFDAKECPDGWEKYDDAKGRTIIGVGTGKHHSGRPLTTRDLGDKLGDEAHKLDPSEMPSHTHEIYRHAAPRGGSLKGAGADDKGTKVIDGWQTGATGGGLAHNNMQPFVALLYCKKL